MPVRDYHLLPAGYKILYEDTDRGAGRLEICPWCGKKNWSSWAQSRKHRERCPRRLAGEPPRFAYREEAQA